MSKMPLQTITIEGSRINDIASFYDEINRVFMAESDWHLGQSLDALNDMLYGFHNITIIWNDARHSKTALGYAVTRQHYLHKLKSPDRYNIKKISADLAMLDAGTGPTYFEIVTNIIALHTSIQLRLL